MAKQQKIGECLAHAVFLRKVGSYLYAFNRNEIFGKDISRFIIDISEVEKLIVGETEWVKVKILYTIKPKKEEE